MALGNTAGEIAMALGSATGERGAPEQARPAGDLGGGAYLIMWSLLWLAVIVTVLSPLDGLFGGGR